MKQKPQYLCGMNVGHDIEVRIDHVEPFRELSEIPEEVHDRIFREIMDAEDGEVDCTAMVEEDVFVRIKGRWKITVSPDHLSQRLEAIRTAALEYVIRTIKPNSIFDWPEENELIEWNSESGGCREGVVSFVVHKNEGNILVSIYDNEDMCDKAVSVSSLTTDALIRLAQCVFENGK